MYIEIIRSMRCIIGMAASKVLTVLKVGRVPNTNKKLAMSKLQDIDSIEGIEIYK